MGYEAGTVTTGFYTNRTTENRYQYKLRNNEVRQANRTWEKKCVEIESMIGGAQSTDVWRTIRELKSDTRVRNNTWIDLKT